MQQTTVSEYSNSTPQEEEESQDSYKDSDDPRNNVPDNLWREWGAKYWESKNEDARR